MWISEAPFHVYARNAESLFESEMACAADAAILETVKVITRDSITVVVPKKAIKQSVLFTEAFGDDDSADDSVADGLPIDVHSGILELLLEIIETEQRESTPPADMPEDDKRKYLLSRKLPEAVADPSYIKPLLAGPTMTDNGYPEWVERVMGPHRNHWDTIVDLIAAADYLVVPDVADMLESFLATHFYNVSDQEIYERVFPFESGGGGATTADDDSPAPGAAGGGGCARSSSSVRAKAKLPPPTSPWYGFSSRAKEIKRRVKRAFLLI